MKRTIATIAASWLVLIKVFEVLLMIGETAVMWFFAIGGLVLLCVFLPLKLFSPVYK